MEAHEPMAVDLQGLFKSYGLPSGSYLELFLNDLVLGILYRAFRGIGYVSVSATVGRILIGRLPCIASKGRNKRAQQNDDENLHSHGAPLNQPAKALKLIRVKQACRAHDMRRLVGQWGARDLKGTENQLAAHEAGILAFRAPPCLNVVGQNDQLPHGTVLQGTHPNRALVIIGLVRGRLQIRPLAGPGALFWRGLANFYLFSPSRQL
jgi:hypothetical protein